VIGHHLGGRIHSSWSVSLNAALKAALVLVKVCQHGGVPLVCAHGGLGAMCSLLAVAGPPLRLQAAGVAMRGPDAGGRPPRLLQPLLAAASAAAGAARPPWPRGLCAAGFAASCCCAPGRRAVPRRARRAAGPHLHLRRPRAEGESLKDISRAMRRQRRQGVVAPAAPRQPRESVERHASLLAGRTSPQRGTAQAQAEAQAQGTAQRERAPLLPPPRMDSYLWEVEVGEEQLRGAGEGEEQADAAACLELLADLAALLDARRPQAAACEALDWSHQQQAWQGLVDGGVQQTLPAFLCSPSLQISEAATQLLHSLLVLDRHFSQTLDTEEDRSRLALGAAMAPPAALARLLWMAKRGGGGRRGEGAAVDARTGEAPQPPGDHQRCRLDAQLQPGVQSVQLAAPARCQRPAEARHAPPPLHHSPRRRPPQQRVQRAELRRRRRAVFHPRSQPHRQRHVPALPRRAGRPAAHAAGRVAEPPAVCAGAGAQSGGGRP
jgi:hypothetical protein